MNRRSFINAICALPIIGSFLREKPAFRPGTILSIPPGRLLYLRDGMVVVPSWIVANQLPDKTGWKLRLASVPDTPYRGLIVRASCTVEQFQWAVLNMYAYKLSRERKP